MIIYCIENKINGKKYVGQTTRDKNIRFIEHISINNDACSYLHNAIKKYGKTNFTIKELEYCKTLKDLNEREQYWIKQLDTRKEGYNLTEGGDGIKGYKHTEEAKLKMKGVIRSEDWRRNQSLVQKGRKKPKSEELKKKLSELYKNVPRSDEIKLKISLSHKGKKLTEEHKLKLSLARRKYWENKVKYA